MTAAMGDEVRSVYKLTGLRRLVLPLVVMVCATLAACGGDKRPPMVNLSEAVSEWCSAYCAWYESCTGETATYCTRNCRANDGFAEYGRPEFYRAMTRCLEDNVACQEGLDQTWTGCYEEISPAIPLSQAAYDFCATVEPLFFECGYGTVPDTCARNYISFNDQTLDRLHVCSGLTCDTVDACVRQIAYAGGD